MKEGKLAQNAERLRGVEKEKMHQSGSIQGFDAVARQYDADFTHTPLGQRKRGIVRKYLEGKLRPDWRVLELNCGTGKDALWLSERVRSLLATDISAEMVALTGEKCAAAGRTNVSTRQMPIQEIGMVIEEGKDDSGPFDLVFSNFDGLNCLHDLSFFPHALRSILTPGGEGIFVLMSGFCAMETLGFGVRGRFSRAFARFRRDGVPVHIGGGVSVMTWFHSNRSLVRLFRQAGFRILTVRAVGLVAPPTSMRDFYHRNLSLFKRFEGIEETLSSHFPFSRMGDHILLHVRRTD